MRPSSFSSLLRHLAVAILPFLVFQESFAGILCPDLRGHEYESTSNRGSSDIEYWVIQLTPRGYYNFENFGKSWMSERPNLFLIDLKRKYGDKYFDSNDPRFICPIKLGSYIPPGTKCFNNIARSHYDPEVEVTDYTPRDSVLIPDSQGSLAPVILDSRDRLEHITCINKRKIIYSIGYARPQGRFGYEPIPAVFYSRQSLDIMVIPRQSPPSL